MMSTAEGKWDFRTMAIPADRAGNRSRIKLSSPSKLDDEEPKNKYSLYQSALIRTFNTSF